MLSSVGVDEDAHSEDVNKCELNKRTLKSSFSRILRHPQDERERQDLSLPFGECGS